MTKPHHHGAAPGHGTNHQHIAPSAALSPAEHWEQRYSGADRVWSGKVNAAMAEEVSRLSPGIAIDLGCGEGGDVLWLAEQGWQAHGLDISATAVGRARAEAEARGLATATFAAMDLSAWQPESGSVDLVTACFFQSDVALERMQILRRATSALRRGGYLVVISHAGPPSWADHQRPDMLSAHETVRQLNLPADDWTVHIAEDRPRMVTSPDGHPGEHLDAVVVLQRR